MGIKSLLERKADYWQYDGKYRANAAIMRTLLDAIGNIQMKYKPPTAAEKPIINDIATNGIKVELYDKRNKLLKAYYVGGSTADERGTHIMMEGAEDPLVGHLPGWEGNLRVRFSPTGTDWRDKSIFNEKIQRRSNLSLLNIRCKRINHSNWRNLVKHMIFLPFMRLHPALLMPIKLEVQRLI